MKCICNQFCRSFWGFRFRFGFSFGFAFRFIYLFVCLPQLPKTIFHAGSSGLRTRSDPHCRVATQRRVAVADGTRSRRAYGQDNTKYIVHRYQVILRWIYNEYRYESYTVIRTMAILKTLILICIYHIIIIYNASIQSCTTFNLLILIYHYNVYSPWSIMVTMYINCNKTDLYYIYIQLFTNLFSII